MNHSPTITDCKKSLKIDGWLKIVLDSLYDGVLITNVDTLVIYVNSSYTRITDVPADIILGRHLEDIRPGSKLPDVIKTGEKLIGVHRKVGNAEYIVNIVPIIENNEIIGAISILTEINDVYRLAEKLEKSNRIIKKLKNHVTCVGRARYHFDDIICQDGTAGETKRLAMKVAENDINVLITGESGTGKELYAQSIHNSSDRKNKPFVAVNCATLSNNLLESELFGYEGGTFTGGKQSGKPGLFVEADGGTLFLDEISEMDCKLQAKLLRALQENVIRPVGSVSEIPVDVRIIAATNSHVEVLLEQDKFRTDLFYRIAVSIINLQPLRQRRDDIPLLIKKFLSETNAQCGKNVKFSEEAFKLLYNYDWPGNIRELKNIIEYAVFMADDELVTHKDLPRRIHEEGLKKDLIELRTLRQTVLETEAWEIQRALTKYGNSVEGKKKVAEALGISLASLYSKIKKAGMPDSDDVL